MDRFKSWINSTLVGYSAHFPYHAGKWRIVERVVRLSKLENFYSDKSFVVTRQGILWHLHPGCVVQRSVYLYGEWESYDSRELLKLLRPEWVIFDIGAYFGYYALLACRYTGMRARVFAFEPYPPSYGLLCENKKLNAFDNLTTVNSAISDQRGVHAFRVPPSYNQGSGGIAVTEDGAVLVQVTTLDDFVRQHALNRLDFIKIDVEGSEVHALLGGQDTIERFQPIMMVELDPGKLVKLGETPENLLRLIHTLGYRTYISTRFGLVPFEKPDGIDGFINLFCFPSKEVQP